MTMQKLTQAAVSHCAGHISRLFGIILSVMIALAALAARGEVILLIFTIYRSSGDANNSTFPLSRAAGDTLAAGNQTQTVANIDEWLNDLLTPYKMRDWHRVVFFSYLAAVFIYYPMGLFLTYNWYIRRRENVREWKCQPERFLTSSNERHEIMIGSINLFLGSALSATAVTYIINGGHTTLYFKYDQFPLIWLPISFAILYIYQEAMSYYIHRTFHIPFLYRHFHKNHHRYHSPTCFSSTAIDSLEFMLMQSFYMLPMFCLPIYAPLFVAIAMYMYYFGMMNHSGIMFDSIFPWQPHTLFHDDHHRHFHTNFGFNSYLFDWLHGTLRQTNKTYGEDVFGGKGAEKQPSTSTSGKDEGDYDYKKTWGYRHYQWMISGHYKLS